MAELKHSMTFVLISSVMARGHNAFRAFLEVWANTRKQYVPVKNEEEEEEEVEEQEEVRSGVAKVLDYTAFIWNTYQYNTISTCL